MTSNADTHRLSVAPMMDWTDRHCRSFLRLISRHALLYTEMVTTGAVLHGDRDRILGFSEPEHPVALQLGGSDPEAMAKAAAIGAERGYDEININVGCPSDRVQSGRFGACLMAEPTTVAACVAAMRAACDVPVTVKSRIGIDDRDSYELLAEFIATIAAAGCDTFTVHARKAWLSGLSPKENREIPPLRYDVVHRLKRDFPDLTIAINGGITSLDAAEAQLALVDGVMIGREAYQNPWMLAEADRRIFGDGDAPVRSRQEIVEAFLPYVEAMRSQGVPLGAMTRHLLGLYQAVPGARAFRRHIAENAHRAGAGPEVLRTAVDLVESAIEQRRAA